MDRADVEIEEDEDGTGRSSWVAASAAFFRCGWWIGKWVTIAGAVITSAPVVIPPLLVLSTLGLAFSFPSGIYLAGYACAEKIMSTLLPLPLLKDEEEDEMVESGDLVERGSATDQGDEVVPVEEKWEKVEILEGEKGGGGGLLESGNMNEEEIPAMELGGKGEVEELKQGEKVGEEEEMVKGVELRNDTAAKVEELKKSDFANSAQKFRVVVGQGEEVRKGVPAGSEINGFPKSPYTVVVMDPNGESNRETEPPNLSSEHLSIVELRGKGQTIDTLEDVKPKEVMKELREEGGEEEKRLSIANNVVDDKGLPKEFRTEVGPPSLKSEYACSTVIVPSKDAYAENLDKVGSMEHISLTKPSPAAVVVVGVTGVHSHDERIHDEEQLWVQFFSMRTIVGYKATLQPSLGEELMALYLFIGVEPPVSLKDAADLAEISNSFQFLKYVVGVQ